MSDSNINMPSQKVLLEGFFATKLNDVVGLARANSLCAFATSCCGIELWQQWLRIMIYRFGSERVSFHLVKDMLMVMGTISKKMAPILRQVYEQMSEPSWLLLLELVLLQVELRIRFYKELIKYLDVYVPGCPQDQNKLLMEL
jgi:NADH-quinone oxidoreductase subunit B